MTDLFDNPMGLMGFEFVEFASPTPNLLEPLFEKMGFTRVAVHRSKDVVLYRQGEINFIVNNEPRSVGVVFRRRAWPVGVRHGFPGQGFASRLQPGARAGRPAGGAAARPDGIAAAGDQGHRRRAALPDRPLRRRQVDLRHRLRFRRRRRSSSEGPWAQGDRPPHAQRVPRTHGVLGRVLRADLQFQGNALLRHQGRIHGPHVARHDRPGREDPHSAQRGSLEIDRPDRGIPDEIQRRGHPACGAAHRRPHRQPRQPARAPACR